MSEIKVHALDQLIADIDEARRAETSRMLPACTVCGWPTDRTPTTAETFDHLAHETPSCEDCGACKDLWPCDLDCPARPLPEVVDIGRNRWMVVSASTPYAYVPVRLIHVGGASVLDCACPYGARLAEMDLAEAGARRGCRHQIAVVRHQNQTSRRPSMPVNVGSFVD